MVFEGQVGGYPVRVLINPPGVVPGQVPITVRVLRGTPTRVTVRASQWNVGTKGAPPAEDAALVPGDSGLWALDVWIMTAIVYVVYVAVEGPVGNGTVVVPMQANATRTLGMERGMGALLIALGTLLVAGMLTIIGAAVREGPVAPGHAPPPARVRGARIAMASGAALLALALFGDLLLQTGAQRTLVDTIDVPVAPVVPGEDGAAAAVVSSVVLPVLDRDDECSAVTPVSLGAAQIDSAQIALVMGAAEAADSGANAMQGMQAMGPSDLGETALASPFAFPTAGAYRVFVQVRRNGVVETAAFDVSVEEKGR